MEILVCGLIKFISQYVIEYKVVRVSEHMKGVILLNTSI